MIDPGTLVGGSLAIGAAVGAGVGAIVKSKPEAEESAVGTIRAVMGELREELGEKDRELSDVKAHFKLVLAEKEAELRRLQIRLDGAMAILEKITLGEAPPHLS